MKDNIVKIRQEIPQDVAAIDRVNELAFDRRGEAELVKALRKGQKITLSLVAVQDAQIVGHILFSPMRIIAGDGTGAPAVGLGPVAVLPARQRQGVGSMLVEAGLAECKAAGHEIALVLGHPSYYPRFGFRPAVDYGIKCAYDVPDDAFMALELEPGALSNVSGVAHYEPEFDGV